MSVNVPSTSLFKLPGGYVRLAYKPTLHDEQVDQASRQFFSLTQVCRQLRAEYLPIYSAQTKFHIGCLDVPSYIDTFILPAGVEPKQARGNLTVQLPDCGYTRLEDRVPQQDIIDLIALSRNAPQVTIEFDLVAGIEPSRRTHMQRILHVLTHPEEAPKFHTFIQHSVEHLECSFQEGYPPGITFRTTKGHAKEWMHEWSFGDYGSDSDDSFERLVDWKEEMGMQHILSATGVHVDFVVDEGWKEDLSYKWRCDKHLRLKANRANRW